jgi:hypothetical protein
LAIPLSLALYVIPMFGGFSHQCSQQQCKLLFFTYVVTLGFDPKNFVLDPKKLMTLGRGQILGAAGWVLLVCHVHITLFKLAILRASPHFTHTHTPIAYPSAYRIIKSVFIFSSFCDVVQVAITHKYI